MNISRRVAITCAAILPSSAMWLGQARGEDRTSPSPASRLPSRPHPPCTPDMVAVLNRELFPSAVVRSVDDMNAVVAVRARELLQTAGCRDLIRIHGAKRVAFELATDPHPVSAAAGLLLLESPDDEYLRFCACWRSLLASQSPLSPVGPVPSSITNVKGAESASKLATSLLDSLPGADFENSAALDGVVIALGSEPFRAALAEQLVRSFNTPAQATPEISVTAEALLVGFLQGGQVKGADPLPQATELEKRIKGYRDLGGIPLLVYATHVLPKDASGDPERRKLLARAEAGSRRPSSAESLLAGALRAYLDAKRR